MLAVLHNKRLIGLALSAAIGVGACGDDAGGGAASTENGDAQCAKMKIADLDDPVVRASYYAIEQGIVKDDRIGEIDVEYLQIPALVQNVGSDRYDLSAAAPTGLVNLREKTSRDFRAIAYKQASLPGGVQLFTVADSPLKSAGDLAGKTLGVVGLGGTTTFMTQVVLQDKYGLKAAVTDGDIKLVDLDPATLYNAVKKGDVDAALMFYLTNWQATGDRQLRPIADLAKDYVDLYGTEFIGGSLIASPESLKERRPCFEALQAMLKQSAAYAKDNGDAVATAVTKTLAELDREVSPDYLKYWFTQYEYGNSVDQPWPDRVEAFLTESHKAGLVPQPPSVQDLTFVSSN